MHNRNVQERDRPMTRDDLIESIWRDAPATKRLIGRKKFAAAVEAAIETAPIYQICYGPGVAADEIAGRPTRERWAKRVTSHRECQFGPLTWIIVGAIVNFIVWKLLDWATKRRSNALLLAGWSAEASWKRH